MSGAFQFDEAALRIVQLAAPFAPLRRPLRLLRRWRRQPNRDWRRFQARIARMAGDPAFELRG